ncbi:MAG: hypothetical protein GY953_18650 [bacterium]|nr:hypothetical protein [bacterium]
MKLCLKLPCNPGEEAVREEGASLEEHLEHNVEGVSTVCAERQGRQTALGTSMAARWVVPALLMALFSASVPTILAAREHEVRVAWEEVAPLVEGREVETVLKNGVHIRGRAQKVLAEELEIRVKRTSNATVVPKGVTRIPRDLLVVLTVKWKRRVARALLTPGVVVGGWLALGVLGVGGDSVNSAGALALSTGFGAAGYLLGDRIDAKRLRVVLVPRASVTLLGRSLFRLAE